MWAVVILCSLIVVGALLLCVPLDMSFRLNVYGRPEFRIRLTWLFGLVSKEVKSRKKRAEQKEETVERRRKRGGRGKGTRAIFKILRTKGLLRQLKRLVKDVLNCLKVRELRVNFRVGLDDPADTALVFGPIGLAMLFLEAYSPYEIAVQPSFDGEAVFEGYSYGAVRLRPIQLVVPFTRFAFSLAAIRAVKMLILTKWRKKRYQSAIL